MKWIKTTGLVAVAFSLLALSAGTAEAQYTPTLTATASGARVTIDWTPIAGALGYTIQAGTSPTSADIATVNLPSSITHVVIDAPPGTYYLRVRAVAGALVGPFSNVVSVTVGGGGGGGGCSTAPVAPVATSTVAGPGVTISWGAVNAGAYRVEFSRTPGTTELAQIVTGDTTSFTQYIPMLGTFYARVTAGNECGIVTGNEVTFAITDLSGSGPRTPDPPPGQKLPVPGYGLDVVLAVTAAYPNDLRRSCGNDTWLFRVVQALRQRDSRWGLNWKRKIVGSLSHDIVNYNFGPGTDEGTTNVYSFDVIQGHCPGPGEPAPRPRWGNITDPNGAGARWTLMPYLAAGFPPDPKP